ncbi:hypothetical protein J0X12_01045 [Sneathiella sp. CAU 1612]|uniref:PilZ domain-containing protein n=1 Tax=Sneathiella sedimenti TaxID=2816034 RepID=A0ABS3F0Z3_9PROT|nr:hypothetical protein [Sneathiella sedimenti]MBO0332179.1 hypothetical protein [Sneathiella sedimenti]
MKRFFLTSRYRGFGRKDRRIEIPKLHLTLGNREFATYDWSLGGFRIDDFAGRPPVGEKISVRQIAYDAERAETTDSVAVVTRVLIGKNQVAFSFNRLDDIAYNFLEKASMHRLTQLAKG